MPKSFCCSPPSKPYTWQCSHGKGSFFSEEYFQRKKCLLINLLWQSGKPRAVLLGVWLERRESRQRSVSVPAVWAIVWRWQRRRAGSIFIGTIHCPQALSCVFNPYFSLSLSRFLCQCSLSMSFFSVLLLASVSVLLDDFLMNRTIKHKEGMVIDMSNVFQCCPNPFWNHWYTHTHTHTHLSKMPPAEAIVFF